MPNNETNISFSVFIVDVCYLRSSLSLHCFEFPVKGDTMMVAKSSFFHSMHFHKKEVSILTVVTSFKLDSETTNEIHILLSASKIQKK